MFNIWLFILFLILVPFALWALSFAPWAPTRLKDYKRILDLAQFKWWEKVYEIGSWDGRISLYLWQQDKRIKVVGIEINIYQYLYSIIKKNLLKCNNVDFLNRNVFKCDLSDADLIYIYSLPQNNDRIATKLRQDLRSWTRVISYVFAIPELQLIEVNKPTANDLSIYLYKV